MDDFNLSKVIRRRNASDSKKQRGTPVDIIATWPRKVLTRKPKPVVPVLNTGALDGSTLGSTCTPWTTFGYSCRGLQPPTSLSLHRFPSLSYLQRSSSNASCTIAFGWTRRRKLKK
uniref:Uncharacterized protein n=1 Tax=Cannabis sativa TaxID=3483 RepID=A0A803PTD0_CANSA